MKTLARTVPALALVLALLPISPAFAEQPRGFYMGIGSGNAEASVSTGDMDDLFRQAFAAQGAVYSPRNSTIDVKDSSLYIFAGYRIFPYLSAEGGYVDLGSFDYSSDGTLFIPGGGMGPVKTRMEIDSKGFAASALGNLPLSDYFEIHGRLGFFAVSTDATFTGESSSRPVTASDSGTSVSVQFGLGAAVNLGDHFSLSADWVYFLGVDSGSGGEEEDDGIDYDGYDVNVLRLSAIVRF